MGGAATDSLASSGKLSMKRDREIGEGDQKREGGSGWLLPAVQG